LKYDDTTSAVRIAGENRPSELRYELLSGVSGLLLAVFMWGHIILVGSILTGARGFDWLASTLEDYYIAQPTVAAVFALFLVHAWFAARKFPARLRDRRRMIQVAKSLAARGTDVHGAHTESLLWIWQLRTGLVILVLGSFHIGLIALDVLTPLFGERPGIEAATTLARERAGLWIVYAVLTVCIAFHTAVGLYRLAVKWGVGSRLPRRALRVAEHAILWGMLGLGAVTLLVMAGLMPPPLAGLSGGTP
jgi:fumarate reductase subunit C